MLACAGNAYVGVSITGAFRSTAQPSLTLGLADERASEQQLRSLAPRTSFVSPPRVLARACIRLEAGARMLPIQPLGLRDNRSGLLSAA